MKYKLFFLGVLLPVVLPVHAQEKQSSLPTVRQTKQAKAPPSCGEACAGKQNIGNIASGVRRDTSCYIDANKTESLIKNPSLAIIDVRDKNEFSQTHIPGAMNFSMAEIKTKAFLKNRPLLIYSTGKYEPMLEMLCADLKRSGFQSVKIISGGIVSWHLQAKTNTALQASDWNRITRLSAHDLFLETQAADRLIISVSPNFNNQNFKPVQMQIEFPLTVDALQAAWRRVRIKGSKNTIRRIVLVGLENIDSSTLNTVLSSASLELPIFAYTETIQSYEKTMKTMQAMWQKQENGAALPGCSFK